MIKTEDKRTVIILGADPILLNLIKFNKVDFVSGIRFTDEKSGIEVDMHLHTPQTIDAIISKLNIVKETMTKAIEDNKTEKAKDNKTEKAKDSKTGETQDIPPKKSVRRKKSA